MSYGPRVRHALLAAVALAAGGGCAAKPYARDPLVRDRRSVAGDRALAARPTDAPAEPATPDAPRGPLLGESRYVGVTSR